MGDYAYRVVNAFLGSELVPAFLRTKLMRAIGFAMSPAVTIWPGGSFRSKNVAIGSNVFINVGFFYDGYHRLEIGDNVRIGQFVRVITATHEVGDATQRGLRTVVGSAVQIKNGSWIGSSVTVMPGVTIATGCVIASASVVYESTEANGLYAGNPARRVRELDP